MLSEPLKLGHVKLAGYRVVQDSNRRDYRSDGYLEEIPYSKSC